MPKGIKGWVKGQSGNPNGRPRVKTFRDYFSETEIADLVKEVKKVYKTKPEILKLVVEQIFGKATQMLGTLPGNPISIQFDSTFKDDTTPSKTEGSNPEQKKV